MTITSAQKPSNRPSGGRVYLIAQDVQNSGVIHTPQGEVWLAAPEMRVTITAPGNSSINMGQLIADISTLIQLIEAWEL